MYFYSHNFLLPKDRGPALLALPDQAVVMPHIGYLEHPVHLRRELGCGRIPGEEGLEGCIVQAAALQTIAPHELVFTGRLEAVGDASAARGIIHAVTGVINEHARCTDEI